jgi:hypothetical protein
LKCRVCGERALVVKTFEGMDIEHPLCANHGFDTKYEFGITSVKKLAIGGVKN